MSSGVLKAKCIDQAFINRGFQNWKNATHLFNVHEQSMCHKEAVEKTITLPATTKHVGELISSQIAEDRKKNRENLLHILWALRYLGRQGLSLRGSYLTQEVDSNFT